MRTKLHLLQEDRRKYQNNPFMCYLNINSVRSRIADFKIIIQSLPLDYLVLCEAKLNKYVSGEIEMKVVLVLSSLLEWELFVKELVTSN